MFYVFFFLLLLFDIDVQYIICCKWLHSAFLCTGNLFLFDSIIICIMILQIKYSHTGSILFLNDSYLEKNVKLNTSCVYIISGVL